MSSSSPSNKRMIMLESSDGKKFEVEASVVAKWKAIKKTVNKMKNRVKPIRVKDVTGDILGKVIEYSEKHAEAEASAGEEINNSASAVDDSLKSWDTQFLKALSLEELNGVAVAAKSVGYEKLMDASCQRVTEMVQVLTQGLHDALSILQIREDLEKDEMKKSILSFVRGGDHI